MRNDAKHTFALRALIFPIQVIDTGKERELLVSEKVLARDFRVVNLRNIPLVKMTKHLTT